jgi:hypothetical protein
MRGFSCRADGGSVDLAVSSWCGTGYRTSALGTGRSVIFMDECEREYIAIWFSSLSSRPAAAASIVQHVW